MPDSLRIDAATARARYLRRHVDLAAIGTVWQHGTATVLQRRQVDEDGPGLVCLGDVGDLTEAIARCRVDLRDPPTRLSVEVAARAAVPPAWAVPEWTEWVAMSTDRVPDVAGLDAVQHLPLPSWTDEICELLDESSPRAWGRPGKDPSQWWGLVDDTTGLLRAVGAVRTDLPPSAHLSGIATRPSARGRGDGAAVTGAITRVGLAGGQPWVSLDAYADNTPALRLYDRLGFVLDAAFASGAVRPAQSATARRTSA